MFYLFQDRVHVNSPRPLKSILVRPFKTGSGPEVVKFEGLILYIQQEIADFRSQISQVALARQGLAHHLLIDHAGIAGHAGDDEQAQD